MTLRQKKQIIYGAGYGIIFLGLIFWFYVGTLKPAPTCTDNIKNGQETEVDCGGPTCQSCAIKHLLPIRIITPVKVLAAGAMSTALLEFQNPNPNYGAASYAYTIDFYGAGSSTLYSASDHIVIYPSEVHFTVLPNLPFTLSSVTRVDATGTPAQWQSSDILPLPKTSVRDVKLTLSGNKGMITGVFRNENPYALTNVSVNGIVITKTATVVAASKTLVQDVQPSEDRYFQIAVLLPAGTDPASLTDPRIAIESRR